MSLFPCDLCGKTWHSVRSLGAYRRYCGKKKTDNVTSAADQRQLESQEELFGDRLSTLRFSVFAIGRISKSARITATKAFTQVVKRCVDFNNWKSWTNLLSFALYALKQFEKPPDKSSSVTTLVERTILLIRMDRKDQHGFAEELVCRSP